MKFKLTQPPLKEETPAPIEAIEEAPPAPVEPPEPTPEEIAAKAIEEAKRFLIGHPLTPALVNALHEVLDDWTHKLALLNHAPGMPLVMIENDLNRVAGGCRCKAYFHNRQQYAAQLKQAGLLT
jgi:hypothetical protein